MIDSQDRPSERMDSQESSMLFKLPRELRELVYEEVLGIKLSLLVRSQNKLGHMLCKREGNPDECIEGARQGLVFT